MSDRFGSEMSAYLERIAQALGANADSIANASERERRARAAAADYANKTAELERENLRAEERAAQREEQWQRQRLEAENRRRQAEARQSRNPFAGIGQQRDLRYDRARGSWREETRREALGRVGRAGASRAAFGQGGARGALARGAGAATGGAMAFMVQALMQDQKIRADAFKLINVMHTVDRADESLFGKMKRRHMEMQVVGREGDLMAVQKAFAGGAIGDEALKAKTDFNIQGPGGGSDVAAVALAMDDLGGMGAGTTASAIGEVMKNTATGIKDTTESMARLQLTTRGTGITFQQLLQTITQTTSQLRLQAGDVDALAEGYLTAQDAFSELFGGMNEKNKRMISQAAARGFSGAMGAVANMGVGISAVVGRAGAKLRGVDTSGMDDLDLIGKLKLGTLYGEGMDRETQAVTNLGLLARQYKGSYEGQKTLEGKAAALAQTEQFKGDYRAALVAVKMEEALEKHGFNSKEFRKAAKEANKDLETIEEKRARERADFEKALIKIQQGLMKIGVASVTILRAIVETLIAVGLGIMSLLPGGKAFDFGGALGNIAGLFKAGVDLAVEGGGDIASGFMTAGKGVLAQTGGFGSSFDYMEKDTPTFQASDFEGLPEDEWWKIQKRADLAAGTYYDADSPEARQAYVLKEARRAGGRLKPGRDKSEAARFAAEAEKSVRLGRKQKLTIESEDEGEPGARPRR